MGEAKIRAERRREAAAEGRPEPVYGAQVPQLRPVTLFLTDAEVQEIRRQQAEIGGPSLKMPLGECAYAVFQRGLATVRAQIELLKRAYAEAEAKKLNASPAEEPPMLTLGQEALK